MSGIKITRMKNFLNVIAGLLVVGLVGCGGGGGSAGSSSSGAGSIVGTSDPALAATQSVTSFSVSLDKLSVANDGSDKSVITVVALDGSNNIVRGATVKVTVDNGAIFTQPSSPTTDANGIYSGTIGPGQNKTDRIVRATALVNGISKSVNLQVAGSQLTASVLPAVSAPNSGATLTLTLKDARGVAIPGVTLTVGGSINATAVTDQNGGANIRFLAGQSGGNYPLTVTGSGAQTSVNFFVVDNATLGIPSAVIPSGVVPSFAANPTVVAPNSVGSTLNQVAFRFLMLDASNTPVPNVRVRFQKNGSGLGYDGTVSSGTTTVFTDSSGAAATSYIPGTQSSPTNGVSFRACFSAVDFISANDCPRFVDSKITVAGSPVSISIGDDNGLSRDIGTYSQLFAVSVVDSAGRAITGAPVSFSLDVTHYGKGNYGSNTFTIGAGLLASNIGRAVPDLSTSPAAFGARILCPNEDTNRSKTLDSSEDINGNSRLDPSSSDISIALASPGGAPKTDANGIVVLKVTWLQKVATWEVFRIRVTTDVTGSESYAEASFPTKFIDGDDALGAPFKTPPYGVGSCQSPN